MRQENVFFLLTFVGQIIIADGIACVDILQLPENKKITLAELKTTPPKDIIECLAHLGKERMAIEEAQYIWKTIVTHFDGIANVPDNVLILLHWVTPALTPEDYQNITFDNIEVIQNFGLNYQLDEDQLTAIADRVREDFADKTPEDYTYYDLTALRQILCVFNRSEIERIHPAAYRETARAIGKLENCREEVMKGFATLAIQPRAFGSPKKWTRKVLQYLGKVADVLPKSIIERLNPPEIP